MIVSKTITLKLEKPVNNEQIEQAIYSLGLNPVRWAIVGAEEKVFTIRVSAEM